jgi:Zn finger protein HypA/HybF involved in hydrogenase expression
MTMKRLKHILGVATGKVLVGPRRPVQTQPVRIYCGNCWGDDAQRVTLLSERGRCESCGSESGFVPVAYRATAALSTELAIELRVTA